MSLILSLSGCFFTTSTDKTHTTISSTISTTTTNSVTNSKSRTTSVITNSTTTQTTTITDSSTLLNYYKENNINHTYHDLGLDSDYYLWHYLPSIGEVNILVIPVTIKGYEKNANVIVKSDIEKTFFGKSTDTYWESVSSFYYKSSYGKLSIKGTVTDWMGPVSTTIDKMTNEIKIDSEDVVQSTSNFLKEKGINTLDYDSDFDGFIDLVWYVYSAPNYDNDGSLSNDFWAFTTSSDSNVANTVSPTINNYCWASYDFMYAWEKSSLIHMNDGVDAHTYIHETGHALGLDDYYNADLDISSDDDSVQKVDMMSANVGDHNAFSKLALGWVNPYIVYGNSEIILKDFESTGECVVLPLSLWDSNAFGEYLIFEYYTPTLLNLKDKNGYENNLSTPSGSGIKVYHVDARLAYENNEDKIDPITGEYPRTFLDKYSDFKKDLGSGLFVAYSNTPSYATVKTKKGESEKYLISIVDRKEGYFDTYKKDLDNNTLFVSGNTLDTSTIKYHMNKSLNYKITFAKDTSDNMVLTFSIKQ